MYLVVGATGSLGGAITHMLLAQGKAVRILARPASNYKPLVAAGAQAVFGDLKDRASLDPACQGVDVLITTANSVLPRRRRYPADRGSAGQPQPDRRGQSRRGQAVHLHLGGCRGPKQPRAVRRRQRPDRSLSASERDAVYDSGACRLHGDLDRRIHRGAHPARTAGDDRGRGRRRHSFISAGDVAAFTLAAIENPNAINQTLTLGGPTLLVPGRSGGL